MIAIHPAQVPIVPKSMSHGSEPVYGQARILERTLSQSRHFLTGGVLVRLVGHQKVSTSTK